MRPRPDWISPGQRSVWGLPSQAIADRCAANARIEYGGHLIADTRESVCTVEVSHSPSSYILPSALTAGVLRPASASSCCKWKGVAALWNVVIDAVVLPQVSPRSPDPTPTFAMLRDQAAYYAAPFDLCLVDGETVGLQPGSVYGGWTTSELAGPFKGAPESVGW